MTHEYICSRSVHEEMGLFFRVLPITHINMAQKSSKHTFYGTGWRLWSWLYLQKKRGLTDFDYFGSRFSLWSTYFKPSSLKATTYLLLHSSGNRKSRTLSKMSTYFILWDGVPAARWGCQNPPDPSLTVCGEKSSEIRVTWDCGNADFSLTAVDVPIYKDASFF